MKKNYFSYVTFVILSHVRVPLLVVITFCLILALSGIQKSKMADPSWPPFGNHDVIISSYDVIPFRSRIYPPSLLVIASIVAKL